MTLEEFSNEFDTLIQVSLLKSDFGSTDLRSFDEYEKSIFLTKAQEELIVSLYNGEQSFSNSFEKTEEIRRYLNELIKTYTTSIKEDGYIGLSKKSIFFKLPNDLWFITYESVYLKDSNINCKTNEEISVIPTTQDDYYRTKKNPFKGPNERRALRLDLGDSIIEIISKYDIETYLVRYLSKPEPIILNTLPDNLTINGIKNKNECKLNPVIHRAILERAVKLAINSRISAVKND